MMAELKTMLICKWVYEFSVKKGFERDSYEDEALLQSTAKQQLVFCLNAGMRRPSQAWHSGWSYKVLHHDARPWFPWNLLAVKYFKPPDMLFNSCFS